MKKTLYLIAIIGSTINNSYAPSREADPSRAPRIAREAMEPDLSCIGKPYLCRTVGSELAAIYADSYEVSRNGNILQKLPSLLPAINSHYNYLAANLFVAGDVGGPGANSPVSEAINSVNPERLGRRTIWHSGGASDTEQIDSKDCFLVKSTGHTESQFIHDLSEIMRADRKQFLGDRITALLEDQGNRKVRHFGFYLDSIYDPCDDCMKELHGFMAEQSQTDIRKYFEHEIQKGCMGGSDLKPLMIFKSKSLHSYYNDISLHNGSESLPMVLDTRCTELELKPRSIDAVYHGRLDGPRFEYRVSRLGADGASLVDGDGLYFAGEHVDLPRIICYPIGFFSPERRMVGNFHWAFPRTIEAQT